MGIRKRKPVVAPARPQQQPQPVASAHAAEVRRRAEKLAEPVENSGKNGVKVRIHQRQQTEQQMAQLRGEAVRARRLAEHIENLSQEAAAYKRKRKHTMTDTAIVDPGHAQRLQRRAADKPAPSGNQLNFNPLHPSMELPPEQLIRLLGMESKKIRNSRKARHTSEQTPAVTLATVDNQAESSTPPSDRPQPQRVRPADRSIQYERCEPPQVFDSGRSGLLVPSLLVGAVAGIAVSGYLFWYQPADTTVLKTPAPVIAKEPQKQQPRRQLVVRTPVAEQKMNTQEKAAWEARIEARQEHLRAAAEQRLAERVSQQLQQTPQPAESTTAPVNNTPPLPVTVPEPSIAPEPVTDTVTPADIPPEAPVQTTTETNPDTLSPPPVPVAVEMPDDALESAAVIPAPVEAMPESDDAAIDEISGSEPAPAASAPTETTAPESSAPTEAEDSLTAATPADEPPAAAADDTLF